MSAKFTIVQTLRPALGLVAGLTLAMLGLNATIRRKLRAPRIRGTNTPSALGLSFREIRLRTSNRKSLKGWLVPAISGQPAPTLIVMHGWGSNSEMMLPLAAPFHTAGYTLLFIDARNHGDSEDDNFSSLPRFAEDLESAFDWALKHPEIDPRRIALIGHSVGAAAALLVASRRDQVAAVISLSAFAHPEDIMRRHMEVHAIPFMPFGWYTLKYVQRVIGYTFDDIAPRNTIRKIKCPVLLAHGKSDATVPVQDATAIHAQSRRKDTRLLLVEGDHEKYDGLQENLSEVLEFLAEAMNRCDNAIEADQSGAAIPSSRVFISPV